MELDGERGYRPQGPPSLRSNVQCEYKQAVLRGRPVFVHGHPSRTLVCMELHIERYGSGRPVIFLHGFGGTLASWKRLIPHLEGECELILIDLKGFGDSPRPRDGRYALEDQVDLVCAFIEEKNLRDVVLVGNSFGGAVALFCAAALQAQSHGVSGLVLVDSGAERQVPPWFIVMLYLPVINRIVFRLPRAWLFNRVLHFLHNNPHRINPETSGAYQRPLRDKEYEYVLRRTARQMARSFWLKSWKSVIASLTIPTLILWGREDRAIPLAYGKRFHRQIKGSKLVVIENCGHMPQEEQPEVAAAAIKEFLHTLP